MSSDEWNKIHEIALDVGKILTELKSFEKIYATKTGVNIKIDELRQDIHKLAPTVITPKHIAAIGTTIVAIVSAIAALS